MRQNFLKSIQKNNQLGRRARRSVMLPVLQWQCAWLIQSTSISLLFVSLCLGQVANASNGNKTEESIEKSTISDSDVSCHTLTHKYYDLTQKEKSRLDEDFFSAHETKTIRKIHITVLNIFDENNPDENSWIYRQFNKIQRNTRKGTIRNQLLFEEGDAVQSSQIEESVRILNGRNYLLSAIAVPEVVCADSIEINIVVRDAWVLEPQVFYGREGGEDESGFGIKDGNFLGTGDEFSIGYKQTAERNAISYRYKSHHFLNQRVNAEFLHEDRTDGIQRLIRIEKSFYSLRTPWALGVSSSETSENNIIRFRDEEINEFKQSDTNDEIYAGSAININESDTTRILVGVTREHTSFDEVEETQTALPDDRSLDYIWLGMQYLENNFGVYKNLHQIQRIEHVPLGTQYRFRIGYGETGFRDYETAVRIKGNYSSVIGLGDDHILNIFAGVNAWYYPEGEDLQGSVIEFGSSYNYFVSANHRWFSSFRYALGDHLQQFEQLTVGGASDLRGYPLEFQRGNQRYVFNLERRFYSNLHILNLVRVGAVAFIDVGRAWGADYEAESKHLANAGLGLRLTPSKLGTPLIIHIDLAKPLTDNEELEGSLISLSAEASF